MSGLSGLRNAYRSVLSALGSSEISGASRWLEAVPALGPEPTTAAATAARAAPRRPGRRPPVLLSSFPTLLVVGLRRLFGAAADRFDRPVSRFRRRTDRRFQTNAGRADLRPIRARVGSTPEPMRRAAATSPTSPTRRSSRSSRARTSRRSRSSTTASAAPPTASPTACCATRRSPRTRCRRRSSGSGAAPARSSRSARRPRRGS